MAVILWLVGLSLLTQDSLSSLVTPKRGCMRWIQDGSNVCCEACHPGNHLVRRCGADPMSLCTPCEPGTFGLKSKSYSCEGCNKCVGAQVLLKECTPTSDTVCGCKPGLTCGDTLCSFCVKECLIGQEPTEKRSCRPCPDGTFNDQVHQKCKRRSTKCPYPDEQMMDEGDAFTDIKCVNMSRQINPVSTDLALPMLLSGVAVVMAAIIGTVAVLTIFKKRKKTKATPTKPQIIRTPTDDPRTLIAVECSFHEAEQEQGSSELLVSSNDSRDQNIP